MIDDFKNEFSFIDYKQFPNDMRHWDACKVKGEREHQKSDDAIHVFLNFKLVGKYKTRGDALRIIQTLLDDAPVSLQEFKEYLLT